MAITISSSFDAGNIRVVSQDGDRADLEIVKDHLSDFYQWFYFRVAGAAGREITLRITNCAGSAYPHGWPDYKGVMSLDRDEWVRISDTSYADQAVPTVEALRKAGAERVLLAGKKSEAEVDGYVYMGCPALEILNNTFEFMGVER